MITFFADFPQKILFQLVCSPKNRQQNHKYTRTCSFKYVTSYGSLSTKSTFCNKCCVLSPNYKSTSGDRIETKITLKILHEVPNKSLLRFMTWAGIWKRAVGSVKKNYLGRWTGPSPRGKIGWETHPDHLAGKFAPCGAIWHTSSKGMPRHAHGRWALMRVCGVDVRDAML